VSARTYGRRHDTTCSRYSVTLRSRVALPAGVYVYKHVGTTKRRGERFFMVRLFTVA
jgi:hypothetical protein